MNIFNGSILSKSPSQSLACLMSENAFPPKNRFMILSWRFCHIVRSQGRESRHSQVVCGQTQYRQSKLRYPLGLTDIGCLHKQKDPMHCRIWLLFSGSILCLTFLKRVSKREMVKS